MGNSAAALRRPTCCLLQAVSAGVMGYAETIYRKLGINTQFRLRKPDGRPIDFTGGGRPIIALF